LLSRPADSFVAGFVGRDRGYRALGFTVADALPLHREGTVALGSELAGAPEAARDGWVLVVDADRQPQGWLALTGVPRSALTGEVTPELLNLGGTLATQGGTLREALDAALSSPSGRGVVVDDEGRFAGTVGVSDVLARIEAHAEQARRAPAEIGTS
jgi:osmoprotectant transport system ATP-binding protein